MAEDNARDEAIQRETTPTQQTHPMYSSRGSEKESLDFSKVQFAGSSVFHDTNLYTNKTNHEALETPRGPMPGDANRDKADPSASDQQMSNRRRSQWSQPTSHSRQTLRPAQSLPPNYPLNADSNARPISSAPSAFQHYPSPPLPFDQRRGYRQYAMSAQPHVAIEHPPTSPFAYAPPYPHHGIPDGNLITPNIHANFQPLLQPHSPAYQYQRHSPEGSSGPHHTFAASPSPPMYGHHQLTSPTPVSQSGSHSPYPATSNYHAMSYPSSMSPPSYNYPPPQAYSASPPMYPQYTTAPYNQHHYAPSPETERQGTWWYLPHAPAISRQQQHDGGTASFPTPYSLSYPVHQELDHYPTHSSSPTGSSIYPTSPIRPMSPDSRPISTTASGTGPSPEAHSGGRSPHPPSAEKPVTRRPYHPNPPAHRSEWVMWAGNVPSDAVHDELWRFFNKTLEPESDLTSASSSSSPSTSSPTGVLSIFLISRSSCAFVNFESEHHLQKAIERFNGQALRPSDPRCPRLVCRVRKKDDDLKAGVGGQRGFGLHSRWVKEQKEKASKQPSDLSDVSTSDDRPSTGSSDQLAIGMSSLSVSSDEDPRQGRVKHSSSSGSYASTNSGLLTRFFPQRYFILKSLTQYDLDLSVEKGLWATQKHNEGILDQAYRTSQDVYLIFSVNKSGEFYGYARMAGPIRRGEHRVSWATRTTDSTSSRSSLSPAIGRASGSSSGQGAPDGDISQRHGLQHNLSFTPGAHPLMEESPMPLTSEDDAKDKQLSLPRLPVHSAPAELGHAHRKMTIQTPMSKYSLDHKIAWKLNPESEAAHQTVSDPVSKVGSGVAGDGRMGDGMVDGFPLDPMAPIRAMRGASSSDSPERGSTSHPTMPTVVEEEERVEEASEPVVQREDWGESFKIEWLSTEKLPFHRTRNIRNPWNHDREIKVSRDGTELEPSVGRRLLEEWGQLSELLGSTTTSKAGGGAASALRRGVKTAPASLSRSQGPSAAAPQPP